MATSPQAHALATCFFYLHGFQAACSFNTNVLAMDALTFSSQKLADILPTAPYQSQFLQAAQNNTGLLMTANDLSGCGTFLDLLNSYRQISTYYGNYLLSLSATPSTNLTAFLLMPASQAFPGGSTGAQWQGVVTALTTTSPAIVPPECFTATLQKALGQLLDSPATTVGAINTKIAGLG